MPKVTTFIMYPERAKEAMEFYRSVFKDKFKLSGGEYEGAGYSATFEIDGQVFQVFEGGPHFKFTEAFSLFITCRDQEEVDYFWNALTADGGEESQCGWVTDKFGLSWQIIPEEFIKMVSSPDREAAGRATQAMLKMKKFELKSLKAAFEGKE
jgi:predicted 3-demethylubiquinone-9 3-methyltransferase (glyoxalase superfamily)